MLCLTKNAHSALLWWFHQSKCKHQSWLVEIYHTKWLVIRALEEVRSAKKRRIIVLGKSKYRRNYPLLTWKKIPEIRIIFHSWECSYIRVRGCTTADSWILQLRDEMNWLYRQTVRGHPRRESTILVNGTLLLHGKKYFVFVFLSLSRRNRARSIVVYLIYR